MHTAARDTVNTFRCVRRHGAPTTPEQCAALRSLPRARSSIDRLKNTRMPAACELCKDWPRLTKMVEENRAAAPRAASAVTDHAPVGAAAHPSWSGKRGICRHCKKPGMIVSRGLDRKCYNHLRYAGGLHLYPTEQRQTGKSGRGGM